MSRSVSAPSGSGYLLMKCQSRCGQGVESRYVVPGASFQSLIKSYLVAATDSGSDSPVRAISGGRLAQESP